MALLLTRYGGLGLPKPRQTFEAHSSSVFENVRVEAREFRSATIRWEYAGASPIGIYRSTDGSSYTLIATVAATVTEYEDTGLADETLYYYKLSDDSGTTFSVPVFVVTYVSLVNRVVNQTSHSLPTQPSWFPLVEAQEAHARNNDSQNPCILCSHNQALVVNCSTECTAYRIILTEDINSISFVGCDAFACPTIEFVTPPGESYGVCGWPIGGCEYGGDECFDSPTDGGDNGRSSWSVGIDFPGPQDQQQDPACPCGSGRSLRIICCGACDLSCSGDSSARLKVCGGMSRYSWEVEGPAQLSRTTGSAVTVSRTDNGGATGVHPFEVAFIKPAYNYKFYNVDGLSCSTLGGGGACDGQPGKYTHVEATPATSQAYDCDRLALDDFVSTAAYPATSEGTLITTVDGCDNSDLVDEDWVAGVFTDGCSPSADDNGTATLRLMTSPAGLPHPDSGTIWSGATVFDETSTPFTHSGTSNTGQVGEFNALLDVRTQTMVDDGCGCDSTDIVVTVTDSMGRSVSRILT